ncbi:DUF2917 domain-containing protein [Melaminivora sp.]|uniref:DUF2917 domain-containing protein n=1 Tax=Melaminivora sp. TaxID=1933032 RepID=UPI0028A645EA|nr:DUF2917 domain-containing protein [Melaminivora sp.]
MNSLTLLPRFSPLAWLRRSARPAPPRWRELSLPARQPVHVVEVPRGARLLLQGRGGRVWLTCDGRPDDLFLEAGAQLAVTGPARLRLGAYGDVDARLRCAQATGNAQAVRGFSP